MGLSYKVDGIVIRRANTGEADRIVTLLTRAGKMAAVARGVRKLTSRKASALELFTVGQFVLAETKSLPIIQEAAILRVFPALRSDFAKVSHAYWAGELVDRLVGEHDEHMGYLYDELLQYLERLEHKQHPLDIHTFELVAMRSLGWQPELVHCVSCHTVLAGDRLAWSDQYGGVLDEPCRRVHAGSRPISQATIKILRLLTDQGFEVSHRLQAPPPVIAELESILHTYLESLGERRWKSIELL